MKPSKRTVRLVTDTWAEQLRAHIDEQPRGYQAKMARETGCSQSMINRIKGGNLHSSEWVEVLARYTHIPIPPTEVDQDDAEIFELSGKLSKAEKQYVIGMMRGLLSIGKIPTDTSH